MLPSSYHTYPCGDSAITFDFGTGIDLLVNRRVMTAFHHLKQNPPQHVVDIIPAYHTLTVVYDVVRVRKNNPSETAYDSIQSVIRHELLKVDENRALLPRTIHIPVCYHESLAPDLAAVADLHGLTTEQVIHMHHSGTYHVFMIGFLPGFAYLGTVDQRIATPRLDQPRKKVPAGSVGIAGEQTGIYPFGSPGGWQLIGQTPLAIFNYDQAEPCLFQPGDEVHFHRISLTDFQNSKAI